MPKSSEKTTGALGPDDECTRSSIHLLSLIYASMGRVDLAYKLIQGLVGADNEYCITDQPTVVRQVNFAKSLMDLDRHKEAVNILEDILRRYIAKIPRST